MNASSSPTSPAGSTRGGRPLDAGRDAPILTAALELIAETGYDRVTMEAIAARAHAGKATLYRRWDSKARLVAEAVRCRTSTDSPLPDTGDVRSDLLSGVRILVDDVTCESSLLSGVLTAMRTDPELGAAVRSAIVHHKQQASREWMQRVIERGQLPADTDTDLFHEIAPGVVYMRAFMSGLPLDDEFVTHIVDDILLPLLIRGTGATDRPSETPQPRTAP